jgi:hypothetical protein
VPYVIYYVDDINEQLTLFHTNNIYINRGFHAQTNVMWKKRHHSIGVCFLEMASFRYVKYNVNY